MPKNIKVGRSEILLFYFLSAFYMLNSGKICLLGLAFNNFLFLVLLDQREYSEKSEIND